MTFPSQILSSCMAPRSMIGRMSRMRGTDLSVILSARGGHCEMSNTSEKHPAEATPAENGEATKSKNQLKNDKKREEKLAKFQAKQAKLAQEQGTKEVKTTAKPKTLNLKAEEFEDKTIPGEKKGIMCLINLM